MKFCKQIVLVAIIFCWSLVANAQTQAPALKLKNTRGATVNLSNYKGKVTLVNFWATWCPPCRAEMPDLIRWQRDFRGKGLRIIGITYPPTSLREVRQFTRSIGVNYPILIGTKKTKALFDPGEAMPLTIVIDRKGRIIDRIEGIILREEFEQKVKPLLD